MHFNYQLLLFNNYNDLKNCNGQVEIMMYEIVFNR